MIETKFIEIRDVGTFIPALAIKVSPGASVHGIPTGPRATQLIRRAGFVTGSGVYLIRLTDARSAVDPYDWRDRTMQATHLHIEAEWERISDGDLIDVAYILGISTEPCATELRS